MSARYDDEQWTPEEFIEKLDDEGGVGGMISWGGIGCFPPELREAAVKIEEGFAVVSDWLREHGY